MELDIDEFEIIPNWLFSDVMCGEVEVASIMFSKETNLNYLLMKTGESKGSVISLAKDASDWDIKCFAHSLAENRQEVYESCVDGKLFLFTGRPINNSYVLKRLDRSLKMDAVLVVNHFIKKAWKRIGDGDPIILPYSDIAHALIQAKQRELVYELSGG